MKRLPMWIAIEEMMQPGVLSRDGMLGDDPRPVEEIIAADQATVDALGVTHRDIAEALGRLTELARERLGAHAVVDDALQVSSTEARGAIPCPFKDNTRFPKLIVTCKHLASGEDLRWTALSVHMIRAHGFYEGKGAVFRLEPARLVAWFDIPPLPTDD
jgi:hypothetical protein